MSDIIFDSESISKQIKKLKNGKSAGPDGVMNECYKHGGKIISDALEDIYSQMWRESYSPQQTREAWIAPCWKGDNKMLPVNYRPIALTNGLSKIFEGIIREAIINHLENFGLSDVNQHGSMKGRSTMTQLINQIDCILDMIKDGDNCKIIYLNFLKAYDKINFIIALDCSCISFNKSIMSQINLPCSHTWVECIITFA